MAFHYIPESVRALMGVLADSYPRALFLDDLIKRAKIPKLAGELDYCMDKHWAEPIDDKWVATVKGIEAHRKMKNGKPCFEIPKN